MIDLTKLAGAQGHSKGNLIKWEIMKTATDTQFIKSGRMQTRDYPLNFGIEPVVEAICYEFSQILAIPCAKQVLDVGKIIHNKDEVFTLVNISQDFREGAEFFEFGNSLALTIDPVKRGFSSIAEAFNCRKELSTMLLFDLLIMNEDRHDFNFGFLYRAGKLMLSPLYDNGYSLLYDDLKGMQKSFEDAVKLCNCNSFYLSFHNCSNIIKQFKSSSTLRELCNINVRATTVTKAVDKIYTRYVELTDQFEVNNITLDKKWFIAVRNFLLWRLAYVRNL